jgi:hypothetical protein
VGRSIWRWLDICRRWLDICRRWLDICRRWLDICRRWLDICRRWVSSGSWLKKFEGVGSEVFVGSQVLGRIRRSIWLDFWGLIFHSFLDDS